jgi:hypothetical protein
VATSTATFLNEPAWRNAALGILNLSAAMLSESPGIMLPSHGSRLSFARRVPHGVETL